MLTIFMSFCVEGSQVASSPSRSSPLRGKAEQLCTVSSVLFQRPFCLFPSLPYLTGPALEEEASGGSAEPVQVRGKAIQAYCGHTAKRRPASHAFLSVIKLMSWSPSVWPLCLYLNWFQMWERKLSCYRLTLKIPVMRFGWWDWFFWESRISCFKTEL